MKKHLFTFLAIVASIGTIFAYDVEIGGIYYDVNDSTQTVIVTNGDSPYSGPVEIPSTIIYNDKTYRVAKIGEYAFRQCTNLQSVIIANGITELGKGCFYYCTELQSVELPNSLTDIELGAFWGCKALSSISIPSSVVRIGADAFYKCDGLKAVHISDLSAWCNINYEGYDSSHPLVYAQRLYMGDKEITNLVIPDNVTEIKNYLFSHCTSITSVSLHGGISYIGEDAFRNCTNLCSITIPNSVREIRSCAFESCKKIENLILPNSIQRIGDNAFSRCNGLTAITLPDSLTSIPSGAFNLCNSLTSVTIPNSVNRINYGAFQYCTSLTSITIPSNVAYLGERVFEKCSNLSQITCLSKIPPTISRLTFIDIASLHFVFIPITSFGIYHKSDYWKNLPLSGICDNVSPTSLSLDFADYIWQSEDEYTTQCMIGNNISYSNRIDIIGMEPNSEYENAEIIIQSSLSSIDTIIISLSTSALELNTQSARLTSNSSAILVAETNMADIETNCGFEFRRTTASDAVPSQKMICSVANGTMAVKVKNIYAGTEYKYRPYYTSTVGNTYYGEWSAFDPQDAYIEYEPVIYTYPASAVTDTSVVLKGYVLEGSQDINEQGIELWAESNIEDNKAPTKENAPQAKRLPTLLGEHQFIQCTGTVMTITLTNLDAGTVYKYRTYAKMGEKTVYGAEMTFTTKGKYIDDDFTKIEETHDPQYSSTLQAQKVFRNTQILILLPDGRTYNLQGIEVK